VDVGGGEFGGVEDGWVDFDVAVDVEIVFVEDVFFVGVELDEGGDPGVATFAVVAEAGVVEIFGVARVGLDDADEEQAFFLDPELIGLQIAFGGAYDVDVFAIPFFFVNFGEIDVASGDLVDGGLHGLAVDVETQDEEHVHEGMRAVGLAVLEAGDLAVVEDDAVVGGGFAAVDAELAGDFEDFIPDFGGLGAVGV